MSEATRIGVVTVTFNSAAVIADFMASVLKQTYENFILYVVDNLSSDATLAMLAEYSDTRVRVIRNSENVGVAEGNNIGIRSALRDGCDEVLLINNDTAFQADLFLKLHDGLREHQCDMTVPKILFYDDPTKIWCAGGKFNLLRASEVHFGMGKEDDGSFDQPRRVYYSPTCCILIRKGVFEKVGLMDPNYFVYFDDTDFCWRAARANLRLFFIPSARVWHKVSSLTGARESNSNNRYAVRSHVYFLLKNFPLWSVVFQLPALQLGIVSKCIFPVPRLGPLCVVESAFLQGIGIFFRRTGRDAPAGARIRSECASRKEYL